MISVKTYLAKRPAQTKKVYERGLRRFAAHIKVPLEKLHEYIDLPEDLKEEKEKKERIFEDIISFGETLTKFNQNTQRLYVSTVMSYLSYNEITYPRGKRKQAVPEPGDLFKDKAFTLDEVRRVHEYLPPIGRAALLLMFSTGMRITEIVTFKESEMEGRTIDLQGIYCKGGHGRMVVMTKECQEYLNDVWLPQRQQYINTAVSKTPKAISKAGKPQKAMAPDGKSPKDDRVIPCNKATLYAILMLGFRKAGLEKQKDDRYLYHPHGLRKSFRSIVGSKDPDLAETLLGHRGYLNGSYLRFEDIVKRYDEIAGLLSIGSDGLKNEIDHLRDQLEQEKQGKDKMEIRIQLLEKAMRKAAEIK